MTEKKKTYRIVKVASELGVGKDTVVEHLAKNGFEVENKPTTKLTEEMYELLARDFKSDKAAREEARQLEMNKHKEDQEITSKTEAEETGKPRSSGKDDDEILIKNATVNPLTSKPEETAPAKEEKAKEEPKAEEKKEAPKQEEKPKAEEKKEEPKKEEAPKAEEKKEEVKKEEPKAEEKPAAKKKDDPKVDVKVVGKIDLEKDKKTPKAEEKKEEPKKEADKKKEEPKAEEKKEAPKKEAPKKEETKKDAPKKEDAPAAKKKEKEEESVKKPAYEKLQGLKVLGKIELPQEQKKKPVASSDGSHEGKKKRKRKTIAANGREHQNVDRSRGGGNRRGGKNEPKEEITEKQIQDKLKQTLARLQPGKGGGGRQKLRRQKRDQHAQSREDRMREEEAGSKVLKVTEFISANELASMMDIGVNEVISACFSLGMMVSINQRLDAEMISIIADEFGYEVEFVSAEMQEEIEVEEDAPEDLLDRAPIITVMGHVDHGKTSLLDYVRKTNVIAGEAGGITQHIGAYEVTLENGKKITFLDTPGHEAFTAMRARGAKMTDLAIIVIAADDDVMPQTKEAIAHAQAAEVPMIFAINKIDKEGANPDRVREQLANMDILVEDWGGKYQCQEISAKKGQNIDELLEKVLLEAEMLELKANPNKRATGTVVEAQLDKGRGIVTTLMVQSGTLRVGDPIIAGVHSGRIKALFNERGKKIESAGPSSPAIVLGFSGAPQAGDKFIITASEQEAKEISTKREQLQREQGLRTQKHITLDEIGRRLAIGNFKELNMIVKGDVDGSVEALADAMLKLSTEEIQINVIHKSVGQISESDVLLASASDAIIVGFQVRPSPQAKKLAETEGIQIKYYSIIYKAIEELKDAMEGMLEPDIEEKETANIEVRDVFNITKVGTIAGAYVLSGKVTRSNKVRIVRDGVVVHTGDIDSLKRFKDDVKEVGTGYECGISLKNYSDIQVGDILETFEEVEVKRKLK